MAEVPLLADYVLIDIGFLLLLCYKNFTYMQQIIDMQTVFSEYIRRGAQLVFGSGMFDLPGLYSLRCLVYGKLFRGGRNLSVLKRVEFTRPHMLVNGTIRMGDDVGIHRDVEIDYSGSVEIGNEVWISQNVLIETHDHIPTPGKIKKDWPIETSSLTIEDGVWIGAGVIVLSKVRTIGRNSILAAGCIVTKDVEPNVIVGGNPARVIRNFPAQ